MKIINESTENAFMIRNDGKVFRVLQHIYGSEEDIDETLFAAEWLYNATSKNTTKNLIMNFIASWGYFRNPENDIIDNIIEEINTKPYVFLTKEFIRGHADQIRDGQIQDNVDSLNNLVVDELNQEFLRARYGGMYNSTVGSKEMVFRVSSVDFNWFDIIYTFVYANKPTINTVTVVKDEESTGFSDPYSHNGKVMDKMPVDEFLMLSGRPVVESIASNLNQGLSILESIKTKMNTKRIVDRWSHKKYNYFNTVDEM